MKKRIVNLQLGCIVNLQWFYSVFTKQNFAKASTPLTCRRVVVYFRFCIILQKLDRKKLILFSLYFVVSTHFFDLLWKKRRT